MHFVHGLKNRKCTESLIVRAVSDEGVVGYGEGTPRPYVTGESQEKSLKYIKDVLWPIVGKTDYADIGTGGDPTEELFKIGGNLPDIKTPGIIAWNAAICAIELALIDCLLKKRRKPLSTLLKPIRGEVFYDGVIGCGSTSKTARIAEQYKTLGLKRLKIKVGRKYGKEHIESIRRIVGGDCQLRLDANGAYTPGEAVRFMSSLDGLDIRCVEQPIERGNLSLLRKVKDMVRIPIMADESLVTLKDAKELIQSKACDYFNLRISKCGGLFRTLRIATLAKNAGIRLQLGCLVGETAILSAAGRALAGHLGELDYVEGSFGTYLLQEDVSREDIRFGAGGRGF